MRRNISTPSPTPCHSITLYRDTSILTLNGIATCVCVGMGCAGNLYFIASTHRLRFSKALRVLLCTLAFWDSSVLLGALGYYGLFALAQTFYNDQPVPDLLYNPFWTYLGYVFHGPLETATIGSVWTTVAIAVTRYFAVIKPFELQWRHTVRQSVTTATLILIFGCLLSAPKYLELHIDECVSRTGVLTIQTEIALFADKLYRLIYSTILHTILISLGPLVVIAYCSLHTLIVIRQDHSEGMRLQSNSSATPLIARRRRERKMRIVFSVLLGKFFFCYLFHTTLMLCLTTIGEGIFNLAFVRFLAYFSNFLVIFNSATNFIVYMPWHRKRADASRSGDLSLRPQTKLSASTILTVEEGRMLLSSWQQACNGNLGPTLFIRALLFVAQEHPAVCARLTRSSELLNKIANMIFELFDNLLRTIAHNPNGDLPRVKMQRVGLMHRIHGVRLTNELLGGFKTFLLSDILHTRQSLVAEDLRTREQTNDLSMKIRVWNKFLSMLITEIKLGYMKASVVATVAANSPSGSIRRSVSTSRC